MPSQLVTGEAWWGDAPDEAELVAEQERDLRSLKEVDAEIAMLPEDRRAQWDRMPATQLLNRRSRLRRLLRSESQGRRAPIVDPPQRLESVSPQRPRERRSRSRTRSAARGSPSDPDLAEPPPAAFIAGDSVRRIA